VTGRTEEQVDERTTDGAVTEVTVELADADATRGYGVALAALLRAGDLVVLTGDLGAGKTTLTQGIGTGLGVRGAVASPTFTIARVHPPLPETRTADGSPAPWLVHVDAYRLGSLDEVDALDLDTSLDESVTVVEWGEGLVEALAEDRLEIALHRPRGSAADLPGDPGPGDPGPGDDGAADPDAEDASAGVRRLTVRARGDRWRGIPLPTA
jgi:tRNA threonylcarbamoyladenosine biosynthesis protein TsaE